MIVDIGILLFLLVLQIADPSLLGSLAIIVAGLFSILEIQEEQEAFDRGCNYKGNLEKRQDGYYLKLRIYTDPNIVKDAPDVWYIRAENLPIAQGNLFSVTAGDKDSIIKPNSFPFIKRKVEIKLTLATSCQAPPNLFLVYRTEKGLAQTPIPCSFWMAEYI